MSVVSERIRRPRPHERLGMSPQALESFADELDALYARVMADRGEADERYIRCLIRSQRRLDLAGRALIALGSAGIRRRRARRATIALGAAALALAKVLENMEIGHNVMHGQWDWLQDAEINAANWEWDNVSPSERWIHSHNVVHHEWANVLGMDLDVGYGIMRVHERQRWSPFFWAQPMYFLVLMFLFEEGVALHEQVIIDVATGRAKPSQLREVAGPIGRKAWRQVRKDYVAWPTMSGVVARILGRRGVAEVAIEVALANAAANVIRNVWAFTIIFCGHFPDGVQVFSTSDVEDETPGEWYLRQMTGAANIRGSAVFHVLAGNLSHQIEHHLYPDLCSNRLPAVAAEVREIAARYGVPYNTGRLGRQFGSTWRNNLRLALPNRASH